ncbi:Mechanosensitive ion channel [Dehalogenimonas alkenigignens]|uniref:Mechanosensitive ion channel n=1 Tax=Dehalogenimonas alkenigignens TaxID=1217799 RepID=A0A0W0GL93_9CHLR|nr:mechanosensitive ion channel family protein [Dehalogenimonas alkenigignens]KTB49343.1 Mechanosensitive ion channel [Dehalogenimonas alkenigignens]
MMEENGTASQTVLNSNKGHITVWLLGTIVMIGAIMITLEISQRNISTFISTQEKYIIALEATVLVAFLVELLARLTVLGSRLPRMIQHTARLRLVVRIVGYSTGSLFVLSILASNPTLGISIAAIAGVAVAFATQNIVASISAALILTNTHIVRIGEEISVNDIQGTVEDIGVTHTVLLADDGVVFVPNSVLISSPVRRKKRMTESGGKADEW